MAPAIRSKWPPIVEIGNRFIGLPEKIEPHALEALCRFSANAFSENQVCRKVAIWMTVFGVLQMADHTISQEYVVQHCTELITDQVFSYLHRLQSETGPAVWH